jgi:uncharacterized repeat protein (TIGR01451 family)
MTVGLAALLVPHGAGVQAATPYSGSANTDLVHANVLNIPDTVQLAEASVAPAVAEMSSAGVAGGGNAHSRATNVDVDVLSGTLPLTGLVVESDHRAPSGTPGPVENTLLDVPLDPLLNATVARATAHSRWNAGGCVPVGTPISYAKSELADANVLTDTPLGTALAAIDNSQGDTVFSESTTELTNVAGQSGKGVKSTALTQLTGITLFKGTANQLTINVLAPPVVEATATGKPGGAKVTYSEPILQIVDAEGEVLGELNAADLAFELDLSPVAILKLGTLDSTVKADGTEASGSAVLLEVTVLDVPGSIEPLARVTIAGGEASAKAPSGGVDCSAGGGGGPTTGGGDDGGNADCGTANPLRELQIGASTLKVKAGSTFTYTISVSNRGTCTLTDVRVEDTIDGPPDSSVVDTDPEADDIDGLTVVWDDVGPLDPGQIKVLVVKVKVPSGADSGDDYSSDVNVTATGGGDDFEQNADVDGPEVGDGGSGACSLTHSKVGPSHKEIKPGQTFNIYISLLNSGGAPCPGVKVSLPIDDGLVFVDCTHDCTEGDPIKWVIDVIEPGDGLTLVATLRAPANAADGTVYHHVVTITDGQTITRTADGPRVTDNSVLAPFPSAGGETAVGGITLPRTGAFIGLFVLVAGSLIGGGEFLRRRSRRWMPDL